MIRRICWIFCFWLFSMPGAIAQENSSGAVEQEMSGTAIVGNSEAPKSLTIIPWRNAEIGKEVQLTPGSLNERLSPLNRDDLARELGLYRLGNPGH